MGTIATLFSPEWVAVVGATDQKGSVGRAVVQNLNDSFAGEVVPVNSTGRRCWVAGVTTLSSTSRTSTSQW